jgi:uncharacterized protein
LSENQEEQILSKSGINGSISGIFFLAVVYYMGIMVYQGINIIFERNNADISAAEAHGMATGMLCVNGQAESAHWLEELFKDSVDLSDEDRAVLVKLFERTRELLASEAFEFDLMLPDDEVLLGERVQALSRWCEGFLFGVGSVYTSSGWPGDVTEILKDITEFTKLDEEAEGEEDESAFMEVTEYLRSAVLLLRDELNINTDGTVH